MQKTSGNRAFSSPRHEFGGARKYKLIGGGGRPALSVNSLSVVTAAIVRKSEKTWRCAATWLSSNATTPMAITPVTSEFTSVTGDSATSTGGGTFRRSGAPCRPGKDYGC